jgi:hypothetical protein
MDLISWKERLGYTDDCLALALLFYLVILQLQGPGSPFPILILRFFLTPRMTRYRVKYIIGVHAYCNLWLVHPGCR